MKSPSPSEAPVPPSKEGHEPGEIQDESRFQFGSTSSLILVIGASAVALGSFGATSLGWIGAAILILVGISPWLARDAVRHLVLGPAKPMVTVAGSSVDLVLPIHLPVSAPPARDLLLHVDEGGRHMGRSSGNVGWFASGASDRIALATRFSQRGHHRLLRLKLTSGFPFGWVHYERQLRVAAEIIVMPRLGKLLRKDEVFGADQEREHPTRRSQQGHGEYHALKQWRSGTSLRHVHWKLSARRGRRLVREYRSEDEGSLRVLLVTAVSNLGRSGRSPSFERAVSLAATLIEVGSTRGWRVALETDAAEPSSPLEAKAGRGAARYLRASLAGINAVHGDPLAAARLAWGIRSDPKEHRILVMASGSARASKSMPFGAQAVEFADYVIDVDAPESQRHFQYVGLDNRMLPHGVYQ